MVKEFMQTFGQECPSEFVMPTPEMLQFRHDLTKEENEELLDAKTKKDVLDAVCDKLYVTFGDAVAAGIPLENLLLAFAEVHRSNMSKLWTLGELLDHPMIRLDGVKVATVDEKKYPNRFLVQRYDGKVLKSPSYSPAQLEQFCS